MSDMLKADLCILGAGSGGLSVAAGAAQMGANVVLVEKGRMGGDCLNCGCVPSKALIAAGEAAQGVRGAGRFGVNGHEPEIDFALVHAHVHGVIAAIAPHDSIERFEELGVRVIQAEGRFAGRNSVEAGGTTVRARRFVIATGSRPFVPPIAGLQETPFLTNETIFDLTEAPEHLIVIGGGPIGLELAQAHRRLGSRVSVFEALTILPKDDPEAVDVVRERLREEGIELHEGTTVDRATSRGNRVEVLASSRDAKLKTEGSHLLVAVGRRANLKALHLDKAGIRSSAQGIAVDRRLRTTNRRVYAIGDAEGTFQFTHIAGYHAGIVIRNVLFNLPAKVNYRAVPWVTYTDPELANVGLSEHVARERLGAVRTATWRFADNDRAQAERATDGFLKVVTERNGRIVGATLVGRLAGELILPWVLAVQKQLKMSDMAGIIAPYPTLGEISKRAAGSWFTPALFSARTRRLVRLMQRLP